MTWAANILILIGMWRVGGRHRDAFLWSAAGEAIWTGSAALCGQWDLASICGVFTVGAIWNYKRWGHES